MEYDYSELRGLIKYRYDTLAFFAQVLGLSTTSLNERLQGRLPFKQDEILKAKDALGLDAETLERVFFTRKIRKTV